MQNWMALLLASRHDVEDGASPTIPHAGRAQHLGWWALQFTPRVAQLEEAVVLEYRASERLSGRAQALRARLSDGARRGKGLRVGRLHPMLWLRCAWRGIA